MATKIKESKLGRKSGFSPVVISQIREYYILGYNAKDIAGLMGLHPQTLYRFFKLNPELKDKMEEMKKERFQGVIERGLAELAMGTQTEDITEMWEEVDEEGNKVKKARTIKKLAPNVKAIQVLAQKYNTIFSKQELSQINNLLISSENTVSMRELLEYRESKDNPLNMKNKDVVDDVEYKEIIRDEESPEF